MKNEIVIHHSLTPRDLDGQKSINSFNNSHHNRLHKIKNSLGYYIAYHYVIDGSGSIWNTREEQSTGYHCGDLSRNKKSIGICLTGNFDEEQPLNEQLEALKKIVNSIKKRHNITSIVGHRDIVSTKSCPGANLTDYMIENLLMDKYIIWAAKVGIPKNTPLETIKCVHNIFKFLEKTYG